MLVEVLVLVSCGGVSFSKLVEVSVAVEGAILNQQLQKCIKYMSIGREAAEL